MRWRFFGRQQQQHQQNITRSDTRMGCAARKAHADGWWCTQNIIRRLKRQMGAERSEAYALYHSHSIISKTKSMKKSSPKEETHSWVFLESLIGYCELCRFVKFGNKMSWRKMIFQLYLVEYIWCPDFVRKIDVEFVICLWWICIVSRERIWIASIIGIRIME